MLLCRDRAGISAFSTAPNVNVPARSRMAPSPQGMSLSRADPSGGPLGVRFWVETRPGTGDLLGRVIVQPIFERIAAGTVTSDGLVQDLGERN